MTDRRLIEDSLPLAKISEYSATEKSIRHGHISTLHLWWARRPLAAARAATIAALLPAPSTDEERARYHELIVGSLDWENVKSPRQFTESLRDFLLAEGIQDPIKTLDPFAGGGSLPLEAERLGALAHASDLNPVAHLIQVATMYYPQRFAELESIRSKQDKLIGKSRLVSEFEYWSNVVNTRVLQEIGPHYKTSHDDEALFWIWARTATCANPSCGAELPLVGSYYLINKKDYVVALQPRVEGREVNFKVVENPSFDPKDALVSGGNTKCLVCNEVTPSENIKAEGVKSGLGHRLLAVAVRNGSRGKRYREPTQDELALAASISPPINTAILDAVPNEPLPTNDTRAFAVTLYGLNTWGSLYNPRQLHAMDAFVRTVRTVREEVREANEDLGEDADEFADAVVTYLGICTSKLADFCSTMCVLNYTGGRGVKNTFRMNALQMTWDYAETNPFNSSAAGWPKITSDLQKTLGLLEFKASSKVDRASADQLPYDDLYFDAIITDPPYYDAVPYSDLSDYFYVWLKRALFEIHPGVFGTNLTPKRSEMVQNTAQNKSAEFFEESMSKAFAEMHRVLKDTGIIVLVFAHKSTAAWETLLSALLRNDLVVTASWPIETEKPGRTRSQGSAALASSVFIACRKRKSTANGFWDDIVPELQEKLYERLDYFWSQGIKGADFFMSTIGPSIQVFGRHKKVFKLTGDEVLVGELLSHVRGVVSDYALQRIVHGEGAGEVDDTSRLYVIWRWAFGGGDVDSGEAIHMAQSMGCEFNELVSNGGVLTKRGQKVYLQGPKDRSKNKSLGNPDESRLYAPLIDVLHRATSLWEQGERQKLVDFLAEALPEGGEERMQRLAQSIVDVLPPGDKERALYENFLVGSKTLPKPTTQETATNDQQKLF